MPPKVPRRCAHPDFPEALKWRSTHKPYFVKLRNSQSGVLLSKSNLRSRSFGARTSMQMLNGDMTAVSALFLLDEKCPTSRKEECDLRMCFEPTGPLQPS